MNIVNYRLFIGIKLVLMVTTFMLIGPSNTHAQLQDAMLILHADRLQLIDGTNINWGSVTDNSISFNQIEAGDDGQIMMQFLTTPSADFNAKLYLTSSQEASYLHFEGTDIKSNNTVIATGIATDQVITVLRCGEERTYLLDGEVIHFESVDMDDVLQGKLIVDNATGESVFFSIDDVQSADCEYSIPLSFIPPALELKACPENDPNNNIADGIYLRWILPNHKIWKEANSVGFYVERTTISNASGILSPTERTNSFFKKPPSDLVQ